MIEPSTLGLNKETMDNIYYQWWARLVVDASLPLTIMKLRCNFLPLLSNICVTVRHVLYYKYILMLKMSTTLISGCHVGCDSFTRQTLNPFNFYKQSPIKAYIGIPITILFQVLDEKPKFLSI